ncbi:NUDIX domain-containing protein [Qipengyuania sp. DGS5-3]|uniref:NUDIX domain-containing protein n=1 Tax=Qipengyuania sp. DGS5-3 TaxID=3349632 RepID=UPI0036D266D3
MRHKWRMWRKAPLSGVSVIAQDREGRVLLVRHSYGPRGWFVPSGGMAHTEEPVDAGVRELREETACALLHARLIGTIDEVISGSPHTAYVIGGRTDDEPKPDRREVVEARFFALDDLPEELSNTARARLDFWRQSEQR